MLIKLYEKNPDPLLIDQAVDVLQNGGVIIYPTDTVYGIGCDITKARAIERVARIKGLKPEKANLAFICSDLRHLSDYARQVDNQTFRLMKAYLPGPYTFILHASHNVPRVLKKNKKTVGIRIPDNNIILEIVRKLERPILTTSLKEADEILLDSFKSVCKQEPQIVLNGVELYFLDLAIPNPTVNDLKRFAIAPRNSETTGVIFTPDALLWLNLMVACRLNGFG